MAEKTYTETEMRMAQRDAFLSGAEYAQCGRCENEINDFDREEAVRRYPAPTRPRVVTVPVAGSGATRFCFVNGVLQWQGADGEWQRSAHTPESIRALADLLANPEEPADV